MVLHKRLSSSQFVESVLCFGALSFLATGITQAIDLIEEFDAAVIDATVWETEGGKTASLTGGYLAINDDGPGNWDRYSIKSEQRFYVPEVGQTTVIEWELGPGAITSGTEQSIRYQIGVVSNNKTNSNPEHYHTTTGGIWIDIDNIQSSDTATVSGNINYVNDTKILAGDSPTLNAITMLPWNWQTENKILRLELTSVDYKWYDGTTLLGESTLADSGIDNEFGNGFRVIALGMNFNSAHGSTSFERIEVTNGQGPTGLLQSFTSSIPTVFSGQKFDLTWLMDADASATIDQGIGSVDAQTNSGTGSTTLIAPDVTDPTSTTYTITVSKTGEPDNTREVTVNFVPTSELCLVDFSDDFSGGFIDELDWIKRGNDTSSVADDTVTWNNTSIGNWAHGEIDTQKVFPIPPAGSPTTITWNLGPASEQMADGEDSTRALRPVMGVVSAFANNSWSLQHWQNIEGGLWFDINTMSSADTTSVSGGIHYADDTKIVDMNALTVADGVLVSGWNWESEDQEFSLVMTDTSYTWFAGTTELGGGLYADAGIDTGPGGEFSKGFRVMFAAVNYNGGRGSISLNSIDVQNGVAAGPAGPPVISSAIDNNDGTITLTWDSIDGADYAIESSTTLNNDWVQIDDDPIGTGAPISFSVPKSGDKLFYRVVRLP